MSLEAMQKNLPFSSNKELNQKEKEKLFVKPAGNVVTFRTHITSLAHFSIIFFVYFIVKLVINTNFDFFSWHPLLMVLGWMLLMTEGLYAINKYNTYWRLKTKGDFRVKIHVAILSIGYMLSVIGVLIAYISKENRGKEHFSSWHALFGLIALISTCPPIINGLILWYHKELNIEFYHRVAKFIHVISGTVAFSFGAFSLILSVYTNWYRKNTLESNNLFYFGLISVSFPLIWAIYGPSVKLFNVIKQYFSQDDKSL